MDPMKLTILPMTYGLSYRCSETATISLVANMKLSLENWYKYCTIDSVQFTNLETVMNYILSLTLTLCFACGGQSMPYEKQEVLKMYPARPISEKLCKVDAH